MIRTLSVAGALAALSLAFWIQHRLGSNPPETPPRAQPAAASAAAQASSADPTQLAVDDLAAWPLAASR